MSELQRQLLETARRRYSEIHPCGAKNALEECFTAYKGQLRLWFNTSDGNTRMVAAAVGADTTLAQCAA